MTHPRPVLTSLLFALALLTSLCIAGCETSDGDPDSAITTPPDKAAPDPQQKQHVEQAARDDVQKPDAGKAAPAADAEVASDRYPNIPLGLLKPEQRSVLIRVHKATLCPCPQAAESLDQCMQTPEKQCPLAVSATQEAMRRILDGLGENDVLDAVGQYIEGSLKRYDFRLDDTPRMGPKDAKVVIVEFADFECPFCSRGRALVKAAAVKHPDSVAVYFKQFPLSMHQHSTRAAIAALAAHKQGRFWEMYDLLFDNQTDLSEPRILEFAQGLGLSMEKFKADCTNLALAETVKSQVKEGDDAQVTSTPTFFINGRRYVGEFSPEAFVEAVESELSAK